MEDTHVKVLLVEKEWVDGSSLVRIIRHAIERKQALKKLERIEWLLQKTVKDKPS